MINDFNEYWRSISNYENYQVSSCGRVRNTKTYKILKQDLKENGYKDVQLYKNGKPKHYRVNRLVACEFIDNPHNKPLVDHIDNNKLNNNVNNLRWVDYSENGRNQKRRIDNSSGYKGVSYHKRSKKYQSYIICNGIRYNLGYFKDPKEAGRKYDEKAKELDPIFYKLNFDDVD